MTDQPRLTLVRGGLGDPNFKEWSSCSFTAASPRGSFERPCSKSDTDEGANPMQAPISPSVMPSSRRSEIREAHVFMSPSLRVPVDLCQRHPVTAIRKNVHMQKAVGYPRDGHLGSRIRWWRKHRKMSRAQLAKLSGVPYSTIAEIENEKQHSSTKVTMLAGALVINPSYLATGSGNPEDLTAVPVPSAVETWSIIDPDLVSDFDDNERELLALKTVRYAEEIRARRQAPKKRATAK